MLHLHIFVVSAGGFLLAGLGEAADALHVADDACEVVHILAVAFGAFVEIALVDVAAIVADGVGNVEGEVVAAFLRGHAEQLAVLRLGEVLLQVGVQRGTAGEVRNVAFAVKTELVEQVQRVVLHAVEIAVVAVAGHAVAVFAVPFGVLHAHVLGGNHLAVEEQLLGAVLVVVFLHQSEDVFHEFLVLRIVVDGDAEEFGGLHQTIHADGEVLTVDGDVAGVKQRQHAFGL